ncbi:MAG: DUF2608 domain-containing protein [Pseudomonadota bacterium]
MNTIFPRIALLTVLASVVTGCATVPNSLEQASIMSYAELDETLNALPPGRSLVVFDLDNTVLTMNDALGGVAWYDWQQVLEQTEQKEPGEIDNELNVQGILYATRDMSPVEDRVPAIIAGLERAGVDVMALTARGPAFRDATLTQLARHGIQFSERPECGVPLCNRRGVIDATHVEALAEKRFGRAALEKHEFKSGRPLSASEGVVMVAGQNKGIVLSLLLESLPKRYEQVVFIDDAEENIEQMTGFAPFIDTGLTIVHYKRFERQVLEFLGSSERQEAVSAQWERMRQALCTGAEPAWCSEL